MHFITNHVEQLCLINFSVIAECTFNLFDVLKLFLWKLYKAFGQTSQWRKSTKYFRDLTIMKWNCMQSGHYYYVMYKYYMYTFQWEIMTFKFIIACVHLYLENAITVANYWHFWCYNIYPCPCIFLKPGCQNNREMFSRNGGIWQKVKATMIYVVHFCCVGVGVVMIEKKFEWA